MLAGESIVHTSQVELDLSGNLRRCGVIAVNVEKHAEQNYALSLLYFDNGINAVATPFLRCHRQ